MPNSEKESTIDATGIISDPIKVKDATPKKILPKKLHIDKTSLEGESEEILRNKKLKLSIEIMEREKYLKELQILKLERELLLQPSRYTEHFPKNIIVVDNIENFTEITHDETIDNEKIVI